MLSSPFNFTERTRKVLAIAQDEARELDHEFIGTEHLLLALVREGGGVGAVALTNLDVAAEAVRTTLLGILRRGSANPDFRAERPYTSRAKHALTLARAEASELNHRYVGTEHLLLGLLREEKGIAAQVLVHLGAPLERVRAEVLRLLGNAEPGPTDGGSR